MANIMLSIHLVSTFPLLSSMLFQIFFLSNASKTVKYVTFFQPKVTQTPLPNALILFFFFFFLFFTELPRLFKLNDKRRVCDVTVESFKTVTYHQLYQPRQSRFCWRKRHGNKRKNQRYPLFIYLLCLVFSVGLDLKATIIKHSSWL